MMTKTGGMLAMVAVLFCVVAGPTLGGGFFDGPDWGDWGTDVNWYPDGQPDAATVVYLPHASLGNQDAKVTLSQSGEVCLNLILAGGDPGASGMLDITGGSLTTENITIGSAANGLGVITQSAGVVTITSTTAGQGKLLLGNGSTTTARYVMTGGQLSCSYYARLPATGYCEFIQTGGTNTLGNGDDTTYMASGAGSVGEYTLGDNALLVVDRDFYMGGSTGHATITMQGGTLQVTRIFAVRQAATAFAKLQGWGTVTAGLIFNMSGLVIANGDGTDGTLSISGWSSSFGNPTANTSSGTNGWYAVGHGKLTLKDIAVTADGTKYWGDVTTLDLVNAATVALSGVSGSGSLIGALYASDHGDVPAFGAGSKVIGVWRFEESGFTSTQDVTLRYDHVAAAAEGITEADLKIFSNDGAGGSWTELSTTVTEASRTIAATGITGSPFLAVGQSITSAGGSAGSVLIVR